MKPANCPCGGEPTITVMGKRAAVFCLNCGEYETTGKDENEAVRAWNSMVAQQEYMAALEAVRVQK